MFAHARAACYALSRMQNKFQSTSEKEKLELYQAPTFPLNSVIPVRYELSVICERDIRLHTH
jgi:hypothetical protein